MTRITVPAAAAVLTAVLAAGCTVSAGSSVPLTERPRMPADAAGPLDVEDVVDGDTLTVRRGGQVVTVRLLGVDAPETVHPDEPVECFGPEAAARASDLLAGRRVWLEHDPSQDDVDRYGRELAYVWLAEDRLVNFELVDGGYAREYTYDRPYTHREAFRAAETAAQAAGRGLWSPATCPGP